MKAYNEAKKAYDEYLAKRKSRPLAVNSRTPWATTASRSTLCGR